MVCSAMDRVVVGVCFVVCCSVFAAAGCVDRNRQAALQRLQLVVDEQARADAACAARLAAADVVADADIAFDCNEKRALQRQRYDGLLTMVPHPTADEHIPPFPPVPQAVVDAPIDADGRRLFLNSKCGVCHSLDGSVVVGSSMKGLYGATVSHADGSVAVVDDAYLREAILDPGKRVTRGFVPTMPAYRGQLNEASVDVIIGFIKSLK
jgi:cytochrome c1